ncbi:hypothetical protein CTI12_AA496830 [Artemisia annua]|uniref:Uncharacterized protein n=1 Tax=Artemisia annua TaxID=35608 RepID=A0A2U1LFF2_ARTAN|nr:hypothetical protein CTI12_AA496830 [Artemisia annua]
MLILINGQNVEISSTLHFLSKNSRFSEYRVVYVLKRGFKRVNLAAEIGAKVGVFGCYNGCVWGLKWGLKWVCVAPEIGILLNRGLKRMDFSSGMGAKVVILGISKAEGRIGRTTTMVLGGTVADESPYEGISMNKMVNIYPTARGFTAIGSGGDDFVQSMVVAVESVVQHPIPQGKVKQKLSSGGKYVSVNIGPVQIVSSKQVQAVYYAMKRDDRMRYFL